MDYSAVAGSIVLGIPGVRACLVVSADGLPLAVHPPSDEDAVTALWMRLTSLGEMTRGFVTVGDEVWAFVQGERYGALVLADRSVRPGQVLELADQALAEAASGAPTSGATPAGAERRSDTVRAPREPRSAGNRRFRVPLHPEERPVDAGSGTDAVAADVLAIADVAREAKAAPDAIRGGAGAEELASDAAGVEGHADAGTHTPSAPDVAEGAGPGSETGVAGILNARDDDVDIVALAREFSALLTERDQGSA